MEEDNKIEEHALEFGGPTIFVKDTQGRWGKYALPEGKRIENGDKIRYEDCKLIQYYRQVDCPKPEDYPDRDLYKKALDEFRDLMLADTTEMTFTGSAFLNMVPDGDPLP